MAAEAAPADADAGPSDAELLRMPDEPLTPLQVFVITFVGRLADLCMDMEAFTALLCAALRARRGGGALRAVNSNFGHECWPGFEHLLKHPAPAEPAARPVRGRPRKGQGDGTGFNSAVELILDLSAPGAAPFAGALGGPGGAAIPPGKLYKTKVFPSTGETQVPGVLDAGFRDGHAALNLLAALLNELGAGAAGDGGSPPPPWAQLRREAEARRALGEAGALAEHAARLAAWAEAGPLPGPRRQIAVTATNAKMLNYKFMLLRPDPRILVDLVAWATFLVALERGRPLLPPLRGVAPPYPVRETTPPREDVKVSFRFNCGFCEPRVNIFQSGKIDVLGAKGVECAPRIYEFFVEAFRANWGAFVCLQPRRGRGAPPAPRAARAPPRAAPAPPAAAAPAAAAPAAPAAAAAAAAPAPPAAAAPAPPAWLPDEVFNELLEPPK